MSLPAQKRGNRLGSPVEAVLTEIATAGQLSGFGLATLVAWGSDPREFADRYVVWFANVGRFFVVDVVPSHWSGVERALSVGLDEDAVFAQSFAAEVDHRSGAR